ncbi:MAG: hypothetical protein IPL95_07580 [Saprospiraceae bacterium]|nr:hypothetical protein [Saprospiraceae bacterium]
MKCHAGNDGSANVAVSGGTVNYTYLWSNGGTTASINNLIAGTYTVTVTDANGCKKTSSVVVNQPTDLVISTSKTDVKCYSGNDGSASVSVSGGTVIIYTFGQMEEHQLL